MAAKPPNLIPSGIEPVDKLLGGLTSGRLYLVHGEAAGKSLFGIKFIIEGLRRGENAAMVIRYSPEDVVRRFARLGYDCLEDIYSGRLVILEYSDDIIQQISSMSSITPILRELEWLLGETQPQRIIFDPVTQLVAGYHGDLFARVSDFVDWARSFGATVVLVAGDDNPEVIHEVKPMVEESFRFEVKEIPSRAIRILAFEKSTTLLPQAIEVDPSRGVFLLERAPSNNSHILGAKASTTIEIESSEKPDPEAIAHEAETAPPVQQSALAAVEELDLSEQDELGAPYEEPLSLADPVAELEQLDELIEIEEPEYIEADEWRFEALAEVVDELVAAVSALKPAAPAVEQVKLVEIDAVEEKSEDAPSLPEETAARTASPTEQPSSQADSEGSPNRLTISDVKENAAELSSKPPDVGTFLRPSPETVSPKDFSVLVIDHDRASREFMARTLGEYMLTTADDGLSGLAKLRALNPDLLVLDFDLPIVDGFKMLSQIRRNFPMPIIVVSATHLRSADRVRTVELGADYYITKPFSAKELRYKARQLIARHRGVTSWITAEPLPAGRPSFSARSSDRRVSATQPPEGKQFLPFNYFATQVEKLVKAASETGTSFSVVGCKLTDLSAGRADNAIRLFDLMRATVRETDFISTNSQNEFVVLLADANAEGGRAFVNRLRDRVKADLSEEPSIWLRSFPDLHETRGSARPARPHNRRTSDRRKPSA